MINCLFCKIILGDISSQKVYEDEKILAFKDINPQASTHILIIPKKHIDSFQAVQKEDLNLMGHLAVKIPLIAQSLGIASYRLVVNCGKEAGQEVFHLHYHLLGGENLGKILCKKENP